MSTKDKKAHKMATHCHICKELLNEDKVIDHCHLTGRYRGAAHGECNLKYQIPKFFPVILHNLSGYDAHLFIKNLGVSKGKISCIPNNDEKYISFTKEIVVGSFTDKEGKECYVKRDLRFIDSFKFMSSSLDSLVKNLNKDDFKILSHFFMGEQLNLLRRKGVYPYDYMDSYEKLEETSLPPKEVFYSKLNDSHISQEDYDYAQKVWKVFDMKTMRDYHDLYLKVDVYILADVFEKFRNVCLKHYGLDPCWYFTAPGLAWDACLKITRVELELLSDIDMLLMIERGIRGGVSMISMRYAKANNPYMKDYDSNQPTKYVENLDANNLYGGSMSRPLPTGNFKWMKDSELKDWRNRPCMLEVDLHYPQHLHDLHNDYPLAPEHLVIDKTSKLIPNLHDKEKYVIHHEALKQYVNLGLVITKIHRGISFDESPWMKPWIDLNTGLRREADNDSDRDLFKLMNNSTFGKTMEDKSKYVDVRLVTNEKEAKKLISKPNYYHRTIFSEKLTAIHMKPIKIKMDKPIYSGVGILDISKIPMYHFHYNYIKPKYGNKAKLLYTDTDSFIYEIETEDFYKDIAPDVKEKFDTSNYPKDHHLYTTVNKKKIGMFKDETGGKIITEFVALRPKLYAYTMEGEEIKKCKGVKRGVVSNRINFQDYKDCLFTKNPQRREMNVIRSRDHDIYTETVNKVALSCNDDKRVIREDGIHTFAHGHYRTRPSLPSYPSPIHSPLPFTPSFPSLPPPLPSPHPPPHPSP